MNAFAGQTALITGGTDGIGLALAHRLAKQGAHLILVGRNPQKGEQAIAQIHAHTPNAPIEFVAYDLALIAQAQALAEWVRANHPTLNLLVMCAGATFRKRTLTSEGLESVFAVQYLSRFALQEALLDHLPNLNTVISVSGGGEVKVPFSWGNLQGERFYHGFFALMHEAVANDMLTLDNAALYPHLRHYNYGPGYVSTQLLKDMSPVMRTFSERTGSIIGITAEQAGDDLLYLLITRPASGLYGRRAKHNAPTAFTRDSQHWERLRATSRALVAPYAFTNQR